MAPSPPDRSAVDRRSEGRLPLSRRSLLKGMGAAGGLTALGSRRAAGQLPDGAWTVVAIPDTQFYAENEDGELRYAHAQTRWILDNVDDRNVAFVSHEGDLVENGGDATEWAAIERVMDRLDGHVPYSTLPGNHDWANEDSNHQSKGYSIANFANAFGKPSGRYDGYPWFGGFGPDDESVENANLNSYQTFSAGGYDFLHLALEWQPERTDADPTPLEWARGVLDAHTDRATIVTTHEYLSDRNPRGRTSTGDAVWNRLVRSNPQVFLVLCGHEHHDPDPDEEGEYHTVSRNDDGLEVYEILANYQGRPNGGNGWLRRYEFLPGGGSAGRDRLRVRTFRVPGETWSSDHETDASSRFAFDFGFDERFPGSRPPAVGTGPATDVDETTATLHGELADLGGADTVDVWFDYRTAGSGAGASTSPRTRSSTGPYRAAVEGLSAGTTYGVRAVAADGDETVRGSQVTFTTAAAVADGDVDGDGDVDRDDVELIQRHVAGHDVDVDPAVADVDGDGDVDIADAMAASRRPDG